MRCAAPPAATGSSFAVSGAPCLERDCGDATNASASSGCSFSALHDVVTSRRKGLEEPPTVTSMKRAGCAARRTRRRSLKHPGSAGQGSEGSRAAGTLRDGGPRLRYRRSLAVWNHLVTGSPICLRRPPGTPATRYLGAFPRTCRTLAPGSASGLRCKPFGVTGLSSWNRGRPSLGPTETLP